MQHFSLVPVKKIWAKPRAATFWEEACQGWKDQDWKENIQMSRVAFEYSTISHHFKEGHKLSQSNLCSPATCGNFVLACRFRRLTIRLQTFLQVGSPPSVKSLGRYAMPLYNSFFRGTVPRVVNKI